LNARLKHLRWHTQNLIKEDHFACTTRMFEILNPEFKNQIREFQFHPDHTVHQCFRTHILAAVRLFNCQRANRKPLRQLALPQHPRPRKAYETSAGRRMLSFVEPLSIRCRENSRRHTGQIIRPINRDYCNRTATPSSPTATLTRAAETFNVLQPVICGSRH